MVTILRRSTTQLRSHATIAKVAQDDYWAGSEMFNCAEGRRCNVQNNTLVTGKPPTAVQPQQEMGGWATDFEVA